MRTPVASPFVELRAGLDSYQSPYLASDFSIGSIAFGLAGGMEMNPNAIYNDGTEGDLYSLGIVPQWQLSDRTQLRGLIGGTRWRYNGDTGYITQGLGASPNMRDGKQLPPPLTRFERLGPDNAEFEQKDFNIGLLMQHRFDLLELRAGVFRSVRAVPMADFTLISDLDPEGRGIATLYAAPDQRTESVSGELSVLRQFALGNWTHRLTGSLRARQSKNQSFDGSATELGPVQIGVRSVAQTRPDIDRTSGDASTDSVDQNSAGLSWRASNADRLELRAGVLRTENRREALHSNALATRHEATNWLPNASVTWVAQPNLALYTSYVRGLEESGIAPSIASNRNEVLPAVLARQIDLGMRWQYLPSSSFSAALFEIAKPTPALDANRNYALSGQARYRGLEASWNARLDNGLSWVLGAVVLDMDRKQANEITRTAVGIPAKQALLGLSYIPPKFPNLTLDSQIRTQGPRFVDTENLLRTPGFTSVDLGLRYRYDQAGSNVRLQWTNATAVRQWIANPFQTLGFVSPSTVRVILTQNF
jgi:iron complex outermembrane recepter protein